MDERPDRQLKLYELLVSQKARYDAIYWQAPALVAGNIFTLEKLDGRPLATLALVSFNWAMIFSFSRMITSQSLILRVMNDAEAKLRTTYGAGFVPDFTAKRSRSSRRWLVGTLMILNVVLLGYGVWQVIEGRVDSSDGPVREAPAGDRRR